VSGVQPRPVSPLDLPLVRRIISRSLALDLAATLSGGIQGMEDALLYTVPLTDMGAPTIVLRNGDGGYLGQFRHRAGNTTAHLTLLAPDPHEGEAHDWTRLLEALVSEAGRRGAHLLVGEIAEDHPVFVAFRMAGFAVFARQVILRRPPRVMAETPPALVRPEIEQDAIAISTLHSNTVPRLLQQAEPLPAPDCRGLVYERDGEIAGYLAVTAGKHGVVIKPYFHPEVYDQAPAIVLSALSFIPRAEQVPVYLYARAYQDWLRGALAQVEFKPWTEQALMVKHTVVRVGRAESTTLPGLEASHLRPPVADGPLPLHKRWLMLRWTYREGRFPLWRRNGKSLSNHKKHYGTSNHG
jgi:hypothetical protein